MGMDERWKKLTEYTIEALLIAWLGYLFLYQNYLLYHWHRGLPLPSKTPYEILGVLMGATFLAFEVWKNRDTFFGGSSRGTEGEQLLNPERVE